MYICVYTCTYVYMYIYIYIFVLALPATPTMFSAYSWLTDSMWLSSRNYIIVLGKLEYTMFIASILILYEPVPINSLLQSANTYISYMSLSTLPGLLTLDFFFLKR